MKAIPTFLAAAGLFFASLCLCFASVPPSVSATRFISPPKIDGSLVDPCWQAAGKIENFMQWREDGSTPAGAPVSPARAKTAVYVGLDDNNLYLAFRCSGVATGSGDGRIWAEEHVEIFLAPDARDRNDYFQLGLSAFGERMGLRRWGAMASPGVWEGGWKSAVRLEKDAWYAEVAIPFAGLRSTAPADGAMWRLDLGRYAVSVKEWASWSGSFHRPAKFGYLLFGGYESVLSRRVDMLRDELKAFRGQIGSRLDEREKDWGARMDKLDAELHGGSVSK